MAAFFTVGLYFGRVEAIFPDGSLECRFANLVTQNKYKIRTEREVVLPKDVISSNVQASYMANNIFQLDCDWRLIRDEQERRKKLFNASKRVGFLKHIPVLHIGKIEIHRYTDQMSLNKTYCTSFMLSSVFLSRCS